MKVREILRRLREDGWQPVHARGSQQQFKHPSKPGRVTVAGRPNDDIAAGTLPGSIAAGATPEEAKKRMREAIDLHLRGLAEDRLPIPEPSTQTDVVEVAGWTRRRPGVLPANRTDQGLGAPP